MNNNLVSIITPCYNVSEYLPETVESVLNQTYKDWELILVDDCSSDSSFELANKYMSQDSRIRAFRMKANSGAAAARNFGTEAAKGRYIAFLDSDDLWKENKLEIQVTTMKQRDCCFCFSSYEMFDELNSQSNDVLVREFTHYRELLKGCDIGCLTAIYDIEKLGKQYFISPDRNSLNIDDKIIKTWGREDYVLWLSIAKTKGGMIGIKEKLARYRKRGGGISSQKIQMAKYQWLVYRKVEHINFLSSAYYFFCYFINGVKKHYF